MTNIHDAVRSMPPYVLLLLGFLLTAASIAETRSDRKARQVRRERQDPIDNVGSWLAFFTGVFLIVAYFWPED